jgi:MFS family permease
VAYGAGVGIAAVVLLVASSSASSLGLFIVASVVFGISSGLLFLGGLGLINANAPAHHRAGTLSVVYLVAYIGQGVLAVGLGLLSTSLGLQRGLDIVGPLLAALSFATLLVALLVGRTRRPMDGIASVTGATPVVH